MRYFQLNHVFQAISNQFLTTLTQKRFTCVARNSIELSNSIANCAPEFNPMRYLEIGNFRSQKQLQLTFLFVHSFGLEIKRATNTQTHTHKPISNHRSFCIINGKSHISILFIKFYHFIEIRKSEYIARATAHDVNAL